jgi:hypothetical protein
MRDGKLAATRDDGNEFLPLIEGVYVQPVERTISELSGMNVDLPAALFDPATWTSAPHWAGR